MLADPLHNKEAYVKQVPECFCVITFKSVHPVQLFIVIITQTPSWGQTELFIVMDNRLKNEHFLNHFMVRGKTVN